MEKCWATRLNVIGFIYFVDNRSKRKWFNAFLRMNPTISSQIAQNIRATRRTAGKMVRGYSQLTVSKELSLCT